MFSGMPSALVNTEIYKACKSNIGRKGHLTMANKALFRSIVGRLLPKTDILNEEGRASYSFSTQHALAQYSATGCLNATFYASGEEQLERIIKLCEEVEPEFIARTAIYARQKGLMKDLPALLCAVLSVRSPSLLAKVFDRVIDSPKMLRNFVQIIRSGAIGRKSLGSLPKRLILEWLKKRSDEQLFTASVGNDPSLADVIKMVHPKPLSASREALYGYMIGRKYNADVLPEIVREYEIFKSKQKADNLQTPDVPFQMLTSLELGKKEWVEIARNASWQMTRMNLNTFVRHGVFETPGMDKLIANRLRDPQLVAKARVFPYQLMIAYAVANDVPSKVRESLQDAMEIAIQNVPRIKGKVYIFPDISGSMHSPITGARKGSTTVVRCIDVAALVAAAILRNNPQAEVIPFESDIVKINLNPRDSVMTNAQRLAAMPGGGTNCSAPLRYLNARKAVGDLVVYISDNESWLDSPRYGGHGGCATATMSQWEQFKRRSPQAKMVCIDIQPYGNTQAKEREDIVNVGGFSDLVFNLIAEVAAGKNDEDHWIRSVAAIRL
jgi:60 kDa SS-A/Ro ribonucleoprotein